MIKVGLLYGGRSTEHDASLKSYETFMSTIGSNELKIVQSIYISREGDVYIDGKLKTFGEFIDLVTSNDIFYINLLHGQEGEDGCWSGVSEILDIKGSFESVLTSSILMDKYFQSAVVSAYMKNKLSIPNIRCINRDECTEVYVLKVVQEIGSERIIVKPNSMGASHFTKYFDLTEVEDIYAFIRNILEFDNDVILQEYIKGEEYTCGVYKDDTQIVALPVIQVSTSSGLLGHHEKHTVGNAKVKFVESPITQKIQEISKGLFSLFRVVGMCRFDFIVTNDSIYYLEGNLLPGFSKGSAFPQMLKNAGITMEEFIYGLIKSYNSQPNKNKYLQYSIEED